MSIVYSRVLRYSACPPLTATHRIKPYLKEILSDLLRQYMTKFSFKSIEECIDNIVTEIDGKKI